MVTPLRICNFGHENLKTNIWHLPLFTFNRIYIYDEGNFRDSDIYILKPYLTLLTTIATSSRTLAMFFSLVASSHVQRFKHLDE